MSVGKPAILSVDVNSALIGSISKINARNGFDPGKNWWGIRPRDWIHSRGREWNELPPRLQNFHIEGISLG